MTRTTDSAASADFTKGSHVQVTEGTVYAGALFEYTGISSPTIGTTLLSYVRLVGPAASLTMGLTRLSVAPASAGAPIALGINDFTQVGLPIKQPCRVAANNNINIASAPTAIDSVTLANGDRVLLPAQTTASANGIYVFNGAAAAMTRAADADTSAEMFYGFQVAVVEGSTNSGEYLHVTAGAVTLGTTSLVFKNMGSAIVLAPDHYEPNVAVVRNGNAQAAVANALRPVFCIVVPPPSPLYLLNSYLLFGTGVAASSAGVALYTMAAGATPVLTFVTGSAVVVTTTTTGAWVQALTAPIVLDFSKNVYFWAVMGSTITTLKFIANGVAAASVPVYQLNAALASTATAQWPTTVTSGATATTAFATGDSTAAVPWVAFKTANGVLMH